MATRGTPKKLGSEDLWELALRKLDRRAYSATELKRKLYARSESLAALNDVMKKLQDYGLLNDARFAELFAASRLEGQGQGPQRVLRDLRSRSVPSSTAESAIRQVYLEVDESELASRFLQRKYRSQDLAIFLKEPKNLASAYRKLRLGGFSSKVSISVLKRFARGADELESFEADESGAE